MTIEKNDQPPAANLTISPRANVRITEGDAQAYTVTLSAAQSAVVTVKCSTFDNQVAAIAGQDSQVRQLNGGSAEPRSGKFKPAWPK